MVKASPSHPLVSVIVPTRNSAATLRACLQSISEQTYPAVEIVVVDRDSDDDTKKIAKQFTKRVYNHGPERSAQRNYGVRKSSGSYVAIIDSDMELTPRVIADCVEKIQSTTDTAGVIIPEESFGVGFWARCKQLERSFYVGVDWMEAARFFSKSNYQQVGGYNEQLTSGEDWDLSNRMKKLGSIDRIWSFIYHNEGKISLLKTLQKKFYYASKISEYVDHNADETSTTSEILQVFKRFGLYLSQPLRLFRNPFVGYGMLFMKLSEFGFGTFGWLRSKVQKTTPVNAPSVERGVARNGQR